MKAQLFLSVYLKLTVAVLVMTFSNLEDSHAAYSTINGTTHLLNKHRNSPNSKEILLMRKTRDGVATTIPLEPKIIFENLNNNIQLISSDENEENIAITMSSGELTGRDAYGALHRKLGSGEFYDCSWVYLTKAIRAAKNDGIVDYTTNSGNINVKLDPSLIALLRRDDLMNKVRSHASGRSVREESDAGDYTAGVKLSDVTREAMDYSLPGRIEFYTRGEAYYEFTNFYDAPFIDDNGNNWKTSEHYFQAQKYEVGSRGWNSIIGADRPKDARGIPRNETMNHSANFENWHKRVNGEIVKVGVMREALRYKFNQNPELRALLLWTSDAELVENTTSGFSDTFWGIDTNKGGGENNLGKLLMELRKELQVADQGSYISPEESQPQPEQYAQERPAPAAQAQEYNQIDNYTALYLLNSNFVYYLLYTPIESPMSQKLTTTQLGAYNARVNNYAPPHWLIGDEIWKTQLIELYDLGYSHPDLVGFDDRQLMQLQQWGYNIDNLRRNNRW